MKMLVSLRKFSGLPLSFDKNGCKLVFGGGVKEVIPNVRTLKDMKHVLADKNAKGLAELYFMYRGVCFKKHEILFKRQKLRYDITVLKPGKVGKEHVKTFGHFHAMAKPGLTYPEVYEVLYGKANYLLQSKDGRDVVLVKAKSGDKVVVPPNYGHVTINSGRTALVMSNLIAKFKSDYKPIKKKCGAPYYKISGKWVGNRNYEKVPKLRLVKPSKFGRKPLYNLFIKNAEKFDFLKNPQKRKK